MEVPITVTFSVKDKEMYKRHAKSKTQTLSVFVRRALEETLKNDRGACGARKFKKSEAKADKMEQISLVHAALDAVSEEKDQNIVQNIQGKLQMGGFLTAEETQLLQEYIAKAENDNAPLTGDTFF